MNLEPSYSHRLFARLFHPPTFGRIRPNLYNVPSARFMTSSCKFSPQKRFDNNFLAELSSQDTCPNFKQVFKGSFQSGSQIFLFQHENFAFFSVTSEIIPVISCRFECYGLLLQFFMEDFRFDFGKIEGIPQFCHKIEFRTP